MSTTLKVKSKHQTSVDPVDWSCLPLVSLMNNKLYISCTRDHTGVPVALYLPAVAYLPKALMLIAASSSIAFRTVIWKSKEAFGLDQFKTVSSGLLHFDFSTNFTDEILFLVSVQHNFLCLNPGVLNNKRVGCVWPIFSSVIYHSLVLKSKCLAKRIKINWPFILHLPVTKVHLTVQLVTF